MKTLVYFDIEATGLKSSGRPRISEISFVAINTQEIFNFNHKLLEKLNDTKSPQHILELETPPSATDGGMDMSIHYFKIITNLLYIPRTSGPFPDVC